MSKTEFQTELFKPIQYWVQIERGMAYFIDLLFLASPFIILGVKYNLEAIERPYFMAVVLILPFYFIYFEYKYGQTLGKKIIGIKVYMENGKSCTLKASIIRNILRVVDTMFGGWLTLIMLYKTRKKQRLGDILARTVVVKI